MSDDQSKDIRDKQANPRIHSAISLLSQHGFHPKKLIGVGKDSVTFKAKKGNKLYIAKALSDYARIFLPITKDVLSRCKSASLFKIQILNDEIIFYDYVDLNSPNPNPIDFLRNLIKVCDFQRELLLQGIVMWDLGITGTNYMMSNSDMKIVDYGGNAFLYTDFKSAPIKPPRLNLVYANNQFIQQTFLLHIIAIGLGERGAAKIATWIQDNHRLDISLEKIMQFYKGTSFETIFQEILSIDLTTKLGWEETKHIIKKYLNNNTKIVQELADIHKVIANKDGLKVIGYQNYLINSSSLKPINMGHEWANTKKKWSIVFEIMKKLEFKSYLDVGSNLGLYVFTAKVLCGSKKAIGIDYNKQYIKICREISAHLDLGCEFENLSLGDINESYDCITLLGVVHHIYCRTENFSSFSKIIEKIDAISKKYVIIEVPTERDPKAMKWTNIPSRNNEEEYNLINFIKAAQKRFRSVIKIENVTSERPIYLLNK